MSMDSPPASTLERSFIAPIFAKVYGGASLGLVQKAANSRIAFSEHPSKVFPLSHGTKEGAGATRSVQTGCRCRAPLCVNDGRWCKPAVVLARPSASMMAVVGANRPSLTRALVRR